MSTAQFFSILVVLAFLTFIVRLVRARKLRAKYSLLWLMLGVVIAALATVPGLLRWITDAANVYYPPSVLFATAIMLLLFISVHFSWELSRLEERTRILAEEVGLLTQELRAATTQRGPRDEEHASPDPRAEREREDR